jgi:sec-independent protein translocase protein TatA
MFGLTMTEIVLLLFLGVLLFGKRLPEIGKTVGKTIIEIKRGLANLEQNLESGNFTADLRDERPAPQPVQTRPPQRIQPTGRKFEDDGPSSPPSPIV